MSIGLMTEVWRLDLPISDKMVLLALADAANDDGVTWMALESKGGVKLDLIKKTSLSRRAIQGCLKRLCETGYLSRVDRPGKGVVWTVRGCTSCAPQEMRPAADAPGGASAAPKPLVKHQPSEANASSARASRAAKRCPQGWAPTQDDMAVAADLGFTPGEIERELATLRDHEFKTARSDWSAVCRNWFRQASKTHKVTYDRQSSRYDAQQENYRASWSGAERASELLAARRNL